MLFIVIAWKIGNVLIASWELSLGSGCCCEPILNDFNFTSADIDDHEKSLLYGFLLIDPLDQEKRDGSIPASSDGIQTDSPLHVREMIFLLNCMSCYCDMHFHGLLADFKPVLTAEYLLALGCAGPFAYLSRLGFTALFLSFVNGGSLMSNNAIPPSLFSPMHMK
jgi:hypothetical protein